MATTQTLYQKPNLSIARSALPARAPNGVELSRRLSKEEVAKSSKPNLEQTRNIVEKLEVNRIKRALERGERLSPGEMAMLGTANFPEARTLIEKSKQNKPPVKFTLSPMRLLLRSL